MKKQVWLTGDKSPAPEWTYYVQRKFAWMPFMYIGGQFLWLQFYWMSWPEANGKPVHATDLMPDWLEHHPDGNDPQMYLSYYLKDPRK